MKVKDLSMDERPREKMVEKGVTSLSNAELLGILFRTGSGGKNAVELGRELLLSADNTLWELAGMSVERLCAIPGIGLGKACCIVAAFELGRRCEMEKAVSHNMSSPQEAFRHMYPYMKALDHEECWMLFLNRKNMLLGKEKLSSGGMSSTDVDNKVILRRCFEKKAAAIILVHNHPSGVALPSKADTEVTQRLKCALNACGLALLDHLIISRDSYFSFSDEELVRV